MVAAHDDPRFVGGHPLAGAENAGVEHARADLFDGATWYLTPEPEHLRASSTSACTGCSYGIGARPAAIDADTHDRMLAAVSHLPHVLANVLVAQAAATLADGEARLPATGPSFRDATRVAGAPSAIWTDIYLSNRDALIAEIDRTIERLQARARCAGGRRPRRRSPTGTTRAAADRRRLLEAQLAGGDLHELRASVPNRPGVIAQMALELGRAGVNITDMALYPASDMSEGVVALWIAGAPRHRPRAGAVAGLGFPVARAVNARFEPGAAPARTARPAGRQVDLPPRRDRRERWPPSRCGSPTTWMPPTRARRSPPCASSARSSSSATTRS